MQQIPVERLTFTLFGLLTETFEQVHGIFLDKGTSLFETLDRKVPMMFTTNVPHGNVTPAYR